MDQLPGGGTNEEDTFQAQNTNRKIRVSLSPTQGRKPPIR